MKIQSRHSEGTSMLITAAIYRLRFLAECEPPTKTLRDEEFAREIGLLGPQAAYGSWHVGQLQFILAKADEIAKHNGQRLPIERVTFGSTKPAANIATMAMTSAMASPPTP